MRSKDLGKVSLYRMNDGKKQTITYQAVLFDGILEVQAAEEFMTSLQKGIGPAKAFGFGLLSLAKG
jgi:CRISPR system Cascade subunit CasE